MTLTHSSRHVHVNHVCTCAFSTVHNLATHVRLHMRFPAQFPPAKMDADHEFLILLALYFRIRRKRSGRKMRVRSIFTQRCQQGEYHNLLQEMRLSDPESHFRYLRMSKERFDLLLAEVKRVVISTVVICILGWSFIIASTLLKFTEASDYTS